MKRTTLMAVMTGTAVLIAGCSSTSGTAAPASTSPSAAASSSAPSSSAPSSVASSSAPPSSAMTSAMSSAPISSAQASAGMTSGSGAGPLSSPSESATASAPGASKPATSTIGDATGGLDAQSAAWFTAFCTGVSPVVTASSSLSSLSSSTGSAADLKKLVTLFGTLGSSLTKTAVTLKGLPAPTFAGGPAFASKVITAFGSAGPALTAGAKKVEADPSALSSSVGGLTGSLTSAVQPLQDLSALQITPATQAAIEKLPACAAVKSAVGG